MRRLLVIALLALAAVVVPATAAAHPLGNFTTNHYAEIQLAGNRVYVHYVLDLAEIPTFQARSEVEKAGKARYGAALAEQLRSNLRLTVDGEPARLETRGRALSFPEGAAGLRTTRLEVLYDAGSVSGGPATLAVHRRQLPRPDRLARGRRQGQRRRDGDLVERAVAQRDRPAAPLPERASCRAHSTCGRHRSASSPGLPPGPHPTSERSA